jgi:hypothetical protein
MNLLSKNINTFYNDEGSVTNGEIVYKLAKKENGIVVKRHVFKVTVTVKINDDLYVKNMKDGVFHCEHGPAIFTVTDDGLEDEEYYLDFGRFSRAEWLERRNRQADEPFEEMLEELLANMGI